MVNFRDKDFEFDDHESDYGGRKNLKHYHDGRRGKSKDYRKAGKRSKGFRNERIRRIKEEEMLLEDTD